MSHVVQRFTCCCVSWILHCMFNGYASSHCMILLRVLQSQASPYCSVQLVTACADISQCVPENTGWECLDEWWCSSTVSSGCSWLGYIYMAIAPKLNAACHSWLKCSWRIQALVSGCPWGGTQKPKPEFAKSIPARVKYYIMSTLYAPQSPVK